MNLIVSAAALVLVLVLAWLVIKSMAKFSMYGKRNGTVRAIETMPLGTRERLVVVHYRDQEYLLGVTSQGIQLIDKNTRDTSTKNRHATALQD